MKTSPRGTGRTRAQAAKPQDDTEAAQPRGSGAQFVYEKVRQSILDLSLPPGSPLDEVSLAESFHMSRTPIREALVRLAAEGLVVTLPNRSTVVAAIDFTQLPFYFEALSLMYRVTTRSAALHRDEQQLATIRQTEKHYAEAVKAQDALRMIETNRNFHVAIAEAGGNVYFTTLFTRLLDEGRRILRLYYRSFDDRLPRQYVEEHSLMVKAIAAQDADTADRLARDHAAQIVRQVQSYMDRDSLTKVDLAASDRP